MSAESYCPPSLHTHSLGTNEIQLSIFQTFKFSTKTFLYYCGSYGTIMVTNYLPSQTKKYKAIEYLGNDAEGHLSLNTHSVQVMSMTPLSGHLYFPANEEGSWTLVLVSSLSHYWWPFWKASSNSTSLGWLRWLPKTAPPIYQHLTNLSFVQVQSPVNSTLDPDPFSAFLTLVYELWLFLPHTFA